MLLLLLLLYANLVTLASFCSAWTFGAWHTLKINTRKTLWVKHTIGLSAKKTINHAVIDNAHCNPSDMSDIFETSTLTIFLELRSRTLFTFGTDIVGRQISELSIFWRQMETNILYPINKPRLPWSLAGLRYQVILARPVKYKHKELIKHLATHSLLILINDTNKKISVPLILPFLQEVLLLQEIPVSLLGPEKKVRKS